MVEVADDDVGQLDLEQVDLLAQDERQQQVERPAEDLEVELELGDGHGRTVAAASDEPSARRPVRANSAATTRYGTASPVTSASPPPAAEPAVKPAAQARLNSPKA